MNKYMVGMREGDEYIRILAFKAKLTIEDAANLAAWLMTALECTDTDMELYKREYEKAQE